MKSYLISWVLGLSLVSGVQASDKVEEIQLEIARFYKKPDSNRALSLLQEMMHQDFWKNKPSARLNFSIWGANVLKQSPQDTMKWCRAFKNELPDNERMIAHLLFLANTVDTVKCMKHLGFAKRLIEHSENHKPPQILDEHITHPAHLDALWATFYATGNTKVIHKIADAVIGAHEKIQDVKKQRGGQDISLLLIYGAGRWSLQANMQQDERIEQIVKKYWQKLPKSRQKALTDSLAFK